MNEKNSSKKFQAEYPIQWMLINKEEITEYFIHAVANHSNIYDLNSNDFKNVILREQSLRAISEEICEMIRLNNPEKFKTVIEQGIAFPPELLNFRWQYLRRRYQDLKKQGAMTGQGVTKRIKMASAFEKISQLLNTVPRTTSRDSLRPISPLPIASIPSPSPLQSTLLENYDSDKSSSINIDTSDAEISESSINAFSSMSQSSPLLISETSTANEKAKIWSKRKPKNHKKNFITCDPEIQESKLAAYNSFASLCDARRNQQTETSENETFLKFINQILDSKPPEVQQYMRSQIFKIVHEET